MYFIEALSSLAWLLFYFSLLLLGASRGLEAVSPFAGMYRHYARIVAVLLLLFLNHFDVDHIHLLLVLLNAWLLCLLTFLPSSH